MLVQHHEKYEEIHGVDKVVMMEQSEHKKLHHRLRQEGTCMIPVEELRAISAAAHYRTDKGKATAKKRKQGYNKTVMNKQNQIEFYETVGTNIRFMERILFNPNIGTVTYMSRFRCDNGSMKLINIDI